MLPDMGENTIKERLGELKMLCLSGSGSVDNKEGLLETQTPIFGGGKKTVKLSDLVDGERLVDLDEYIVLYAWNEHFGAHTKEEQRKCELRYYKSDEKVHYIEGGNDQGTEGHREYWRVHERLSKIKDEAYEVTQQKVKFDPKAQIEEVRLYNNGSEELWEMKHRSWSNIIPT